MILSNILLRYRFGSKLGKGDRLQQKNPWHLELVNNTVVIISSHSVIPETSPRSTEWRDLVVSLDQIGAVLVKTGRPT
jgi:hypothetical protein